MSQALNKARASMLRAARAYAAAIYASEFKVDACGREILERWQRRTDVTRYRLENMAIVHGGYACACECAVRGED